MVNNSVTEILDRPFELMIIPCSAIVSYTMSMILLHASGKYVDVQHTLSRPC